MAVRIAGRLVGAAVRSSFFLTWPPGAGGAGEGNYVMICRCRLLACPALQGPDVPHQPLARPSMGCPGLGEPDIGASRPEMNRPYGLLRVSEKWNWMMFNAE